MKRFLTLIALIVTLTLMLASCEVIGEIKDMIGLGTPSSAETVWASDVKATMVFREETDDITSLYQHIYQSTGVAPGTAPAHSAETKNEIVVGDIGREISKTAYLKLDRFADIYSLEEKGSSAYLIYAEGGSIAIAYSDTYARYAAIDYLIENSASGSFTANGVVAKSEFNTEDFIAEHRNASREEGFVKVEETLGKEATDALRMIYALFDDDFYYLIANLYDPGVGGFYYSVSARDNYGYLPDIESTVQALNLIDNAGLSNGYEGVELKGYNDTMYWPNYLSDEMNEQLYAFALSLKAEDGYFYHPQWGTDISSGRKGRDQGWGNRLIAALEEKVGSKISSVNYASTASYVAPANKALTDKLEASSASIAVSKFINSGRALGASAFEESLISQAAFEAWLDSGLAKNSYSVGNTINSNISAIKKANLFDFLRQYLTDHQFENGLWEKETSYNAINGLMKLCNVFGGDYPFPNAKAAIDSTIEVMLNPELEVETICFVYNPWVAIKRVIPQCSQEDQAEFTKYFRDNAAMLITDTFKKLAVFKKDDGGFSMEPEHSSQFSQMALVALADQAESDVNATGIAVSTVVNYMLPVFGVNAPDMYSKFDSIYFREILDNLQPVIKKTSNSKIEVVDFDYYDPSEGEAANGIVLYPATTVQTNIGNDTLDENGYYKWLSTSVVPNPDPLADPEDLVLRAIDYVYDYDKNGKAEDGKSPAEMAGSGSSIEFMMTNAQSVGECYVFEADLYFNSASATNMNDCLAQIIFQTAKGNSTHSAWMNVYSYTKGGKTYLRLQENWAGPDKVTDGEVVTGIPVDQWFNLRCETYKIYNGDGKLSIMMKFYLNGEYAGECDGGGYWQTSTGGSYIDRIISSVKFSLYRSSTSEWYFNNVYAYRSTDTYVKEDLPAYILPSDTENYDFETDSIVSNKYFDIVNYTKGENAEDVRNYIDKQTLPSYDAGAFLSIATDPKNASNSVLKIYTNTATSASETSGITLTPYVKDNNGQVYVLDYDYYFESEKDLSAATMATYNVIYGGKTETGSAQAIYKPTITTEIPMFRPGNTKSTSLNLESGSWIRIRTVLDGSRKTLTTYVSLDGGNTWQSYMESDVVLASNRIAAIKLCFNAVEAEERVQYVDDLSFVMIKELYMTLTDGTEQTFGVPLKATSSDTKVYDFNTDSMTTSDKNASIYNALGSSDSVIDSTSSATGIAGSFLTISADPKNAANKVLKVVSNQNADESAATASFITLNPYVEDEGGMVFVFEFDHYYASEENSAWGGIDYFDVNFSDFSTVSAQAVYKPTLSDADGDGKLDIKYRGGNISGDVGTALNTEGGKWIKIRAVIDDESNEMYIYMSTNGGESWDLCLSKAVALNEASIVSMSLRFSAGIAVNRVQYFDNISFVQVNEFSLNVAGTTVSFGK